MLINCVAYENGKKLADIPVEDISEYVRRPDCFVWVALKDPEDEELETMREEFGLHELAVEDARHGHQRPKIEEYGDSLFCVLHMVEMSYDAQMEMGEAHIFVGSNYVLSVRRNAKQGFANVRERCEREPHLLTHGSAFVLYALMDTVVDRYFPIVDTLEQELERIEDRIFAKGSSARVNVQELYDLKRRLMIIQHAVGPLSEAVSRLYGGRVPPICVGMQEYFRDIYDHLQRVSKSVENNREMLTTAIQVNLSMITLDESLVSKQLAAYGALFAVPTMIAGIYGMNFEHMPELKWITGYPLAILLMVVIDALLWYRFKKAGWI